MESVKMEKLAPVSSDERGEITDVLSEPIKHVSIITSKKGTVRGNHYHKLQTQYTYILKGRMELKTKDIRQKNPEVKTAIMEKGCLVTIPPNVIHTYTALEDSVFIALTTEHRINEGYEEDTFRVKI